MSLQIARTQLLMSSSNLVSRAGPFTKTVREKSLQPDSGGVNWLADHNFIVHI